MDISKNRGGPPKKHPILTGFSIINHPFWGTPIYGNTHLFKSRELPNGCFNWMIPNLYIGNGCFTKHPFLNGCQRGSRYMIKIISNLWFLFTFSGVSQVARFNFDVAVNVAKQAPFRPEECQNFT